MVGGACSVPPTIGSLSAGGDVSFPLRLTDTTIPKPGTSAGYSMGAKCPLAPASVENGSSSVERGATREPVSSSDLEWSRTAGPAVACQG